MTSLGDYCNISQVSAEFKHKVHDADNGEQPLQARPESSSGSEPRVANIQVIERVGQILGLLTTENASLKTAETAAELGMQRTTVHRYLASMVPAGILQRQEDGSFVPGPLMVQVGALALGARTILHLARPLMRELAHETRQTVVLSQWGRHGPVVVLVEEDRTREVRLTVNIGYALRLDTAQAAVFLGHHPDPVLARQLIDQLPESLAAEVNEMTARAREERLVIRTSEPHGIRAMAAPVFEDDEMTAVMALVGTSTEVEVETNSHQARRLTTTVRRLSMALSSEAPPS